MTRFISQKLRFYSFVCIALLLFVHGYNLKETYLQRDSLVNEPLTLTTFIEYFLANGVLRFRLPLLFIISGYIFAMQDQRPYGERIKKRFVTLIIPYLIWSAIGLLLTYLFQQFAVTDQAVKFAQLDQLGDNRHYSEIGWWGSKGILFRWIVAPVSYQLWFIKSLFFYNLLYPLLKWIVTRYAKYWFAIVGIMWFLGMGFYVVESMGLLFFSLGIWLCKTNFPLDKKPSWFSSYLTWLFFLGLCVIKTFLAFELDNDGSSFHNWVFAVLYVVSVVAGVVAIWFSMDRIVRWFMNRKWFVWATAFAFVIYGLHVPLLPYAMRLSSIYLHDIPNYRLIAYVMVPLLILFVCIVLGALLRALLPKFYRMATGGRGF
jgi:fucose 4-O-acetylase-like acetyltransferase